MNPDLYNNLQIAMETIAGTPVPPNMVAFSHWFYGNYNQSSLANSPAIKFLPVPVSNTAGVFATAMSTRILTSLDTLKTLRPTTAILAKVVMRDKAWYQTPHYSSEILHDENFTTLFANAPFKVALKESFKTYDRNELFNYISFGDTDGGILGLTTKRIKFGVAQVANYGLLVYPNTADIVDTRFSYTTGTDNIVPIFNPSYLKINDAFGRGEIATVYNTEANPPVTNETPNYVRFGSEMVNQVSWVSVAENQRQMIVHLVGCDKIQLKTAKYDNNKGKRSK